MYFFTSYTCASFCQFYQVHAFFSYLLLLNVFIKQQDCLLSMVFIILSISDVRYRYRILTTDLKHGLQYIYRRPENLFPCRAACQRGEGEVETATPSYQRLPSELSPFPTSARSISPNTAKLWKSGCKASCT